MKIKNKRILKNGAIAGYVYYKNEKKWKWRIVGNINSSRSNNYIQYGGGWNTTPYEVFGLSNFSIINKNELKKKYRKLSKRWHPNKNPKNIKGATKKFKEITGAYKILSNEKMKKKYDLGIPFEFKNPRESQERHRQTPSAQHRQTPSAQHRQTPSAQHRQTPSAQHWQTPRPPRSQHREYYQYFVNFYNLNETDKQYAYNLINYEKLRLYNKFYLRKPIGSENLNLTKEINRINKNLKKFMFEDIEFNHFIIIEKSLELYIKSVSLRRYSRHTENVFGEQQLEKYRNERNQQCYLKYVNLGDRLANLKKYIREKKQIDLITQYFEYPFLINIVIDEKTFKLKFAFAKCFNRESKGLPNIKLINDNACEYLKNYNGGPKIYKPKKSYLQYITVDNKIINAGQRGSQEEIPVQFVLPD